MTQPRKQLVSVSDTPYYHVVSRCVRRAYLCGQDPLTGKSYEHRRQWIENRIRILSSIFSIDICAYSVMSNHLHIVVKILPDEIDLLSNIEVAERWCSLFKGPILVQRLQAGETLCSAELQTVDDCIKLYRKRLANLSWFMKCLNEPIARQANKEDLCTGHFWESRFKSQALLTEQALLSCMAYVDLNPIRANMAATPEASEYTSIKERIKPTFNPDLAAQEQIENQSLLRFNIAERPLAKFEGNEKNGQHNGILFSLVDYLELVDSTGRIILSDKRGAIPSNLPPILERMGINLETWLTSATEFESTYYRRLTKPRKRKCLANTG